jgi:two-component system cell cycle sensor histidine kinase/response regulator CckA
MTARAESPGSIRVLLIEDSEADADLMVHAITRGYPSAQFDWAVTRKQFTERLAASEYDVIIADYRLPDWNGMEAVRELRHLGLDIPLILVTGELGDERAVECVKAGAADYVLKTGNLARLPIAVARAIEEKRSRDESRRSHQLVEKAQQQAREQEQRFLQLAETIDEVFFVMDAQHRETLYINPAYEKIWGRSCQSLYDNPQSFVDPVPAGDKERLVKYMDRVSCGEQAGKLEYRIIQPGGNIRWLLTHAVPIRNEQGDVYRIGGVALDITESREAQMALEEIAERLRKLTETSFDAIDITQDGIIQEANPGYLKMFGYESMDEVVGRPVTDFVGGGSYHDVAMRLANNIEGTYELEGRRKDGKKLLLEATARTHVIKGRTVRITALRDMTERRALEDQFRQAQKMEAVGRLAGGVAHDFNNLLTVILSYTDMLIEGVSPKDPRAEDLTEIRKATVAAASLTRQLLAFSRQQVIEPRLINLNDIVTSSEKMLRRLIGEDIEVQTTLSSTPLTVMIDPGQLEQVLMNLAVNARDAMPTGGKLTLETANLTLDAEYARDHWPVVPGNFAMLAMSDIGCGMDDQTRARIFEPFFTTKGAGEGTGLGLATVYGIVKQSNGFIWVYSEPGNGTSFKIYFPLLDQNTEPFASIEQTEAPRGGTETILLAEDATSVRVAARQILERFGYTVFEAANGMEALTKAQNGARIDLLLTDVVMPEMSGRELVDRFALLRPNTKALFMSGYTDDAIIRHGVLRPGTAYLQKPFSPDTLGKKVREVLDSRTGPEPQSVKIALADV